MKVRGYIFSRPFMGERVPQHIQNQTIRNYCNENNLDYNLSASEYAMENSYLILEELMNKIQSLDGIVFYSLFQLPEDKNYRKKIYKNILKKNKKIYFSVENYKFLSKNDIIDLENIWDIKSILPKCYKG
jgi:sporadic carbohydrate cluster protein (TIGR04323 family)|tara:strand:+ start:862 stop:1251 length:390 start_codon:yes stop_codon:yes gene_type:complete